MMPPAAWTSSTWTSATEGATLHRTGTRRDRRSMSCMVKGTSPSCAAASRCSTVLVEPPMAMSSVIAFSNAAKLAIVAGEDGGIVGLVVAAGDFDDLAAGLEEQLLAVGVGGDDGAVAGKARPSASARQFMELAVNMPEQEPQVGQAERSITSTSSSVLALSAAAIIASIRSTRRSCPCARPCRPPSGRRRRRSPGC